MHRFEKYFNTTSSTSVPQESIENHTLPRTPHEARFRQSKDIKNIRNVNDSYKRTQISGFPKTRPYAQQSSFNSSSPQNKTLSTSKVYHDRFHNSNTSCYSFIDKPNVIHRMKKNKQMTPHNVQPGRLTKRGSRSYDKLETSNDEKISIELGTQEHVHLPKLEPDELQFLQLVFEDDVSAVEEYLTEHPLLNINCMDFQGVSALHIAVQNKSEKMVSLLLKYRNIDIGDSVLHAIRNNSIKILVMLLDAQRNISPGLEMAGSAHSADFPAHVTPLILAAQMGHFEIVMLLMGRGHTITRPHFPNCKCDTCRSNYITGDSLHFNIARLSVYQAISSPAYLVHVSADPTLTAFLLTAELATNASTYRHLAAAYLQLADDVSAFAVDIIGCCRTSEEVEFILKQTNGCSCRRHFALPRLLMAMDYKQKEFVAHPNTQQVLESYWIGDWYQWKTKSLLSKICLFLRRITITPVMLLVCMIAPHHSLVKHWRIPLNRLITHVSAYFVFLGLVFYISNQDKSKQNRGPPNTGSRPTLEKVNRSFQHEWAGSTGEVLGTISLEININNSIPTAVFRSMRAEGPLILFICGYTWSAIRMCLMQGPRRYFTKIWNWAEIFMLILFAITFALWVVSAIDVANNCKKINQERKYWPAHDPTLLAEGTFCLATIFAFLRLMFLFQLNYQLGPLQVSLGKMTIDIYKYIIIFSIIICAFAAGLARLYQYYEGMVREDGYGMKTVQVSSFTSLSDTLNTLFWALFCMAPLESADVVLENTRDTKTESNTYSKHSYTERIGYFCFGCFEVISVIVVLNMLIATMSNTFQRVTDNVDIEWTFGKSEIYIDYMMQTTLPSPFNLIPTASGMGSVLEWIMIKISPPPGAYAKWSFPYCCYIERDLEANIQREFPALMSVIVQRYFRDKNCSRIYLSSVETDIDAVRRDLESIKKTLEKSLPPTHANQEVYDLDSEQV